MKMTPEQKAFYEFGKALGELKRFRLDHWAWCCVRFLDRRHAWRSGDGFAGELQDIVNKHAYLIRDAWKKRAACRAWVPLKERNCNNCMHLYRDTKFGSPCFCCPGIDDEIPDNWEPRKEGES